MAMKFDIVTYFESSKVLNAELSTMPEQPNCVNAY